MYHAQIIVEAEFESLDDFNDAMCIIKLSADHIAKESIVTSDVNYVAPLREQLEGKRV